MKCARYVLAGAIVGPAALAVFIAVIFGPLFIAEKLLGIHPAWGLLGTASVVGGVIGAMTCWENRKGAA